VVLPALLLPFQGSHPGWLREWALVLFTPLPYLLFMTDMQLPAHVALTGYMLALMAAMVHDLRRGSARASVVDPASL
jgi:hypothetical protein